MPTSPWAPTSSEERQLVLSELDAIVSSSHFRGSKRYPALLKYVVVAALDDRLGDLKERTLGVEVFGRDPGYDTNVDPVVRVSAGEVRKRIAQYYHQNRHLSAVQIEMPLGSYAPEFLLHHPAADVLNPYSEQLAAAEKSARPRRAVIRQVLLSLALLVLAAGGVAAYFYHHAEQSGEAALLNLWRPLFNAPQPVLIVLGTTHPTDMRPPSDESTFSDHIANPYHQVSVSVAKALAHLSGVLENHKKAYGVKESHETSLEDIRSRPIVLVGAINSDLSMRLISPLRYHFTFGANGNGVDSIVDSADPRPTGWSVDRSKPYLSITADYAIVARFHDATTEGPVLVIAGLGPDGTEAASEFAQSPQHLAELAAKLPRGWENRNLEVVLKTNVIGAEAGPPVLLSVYSW